MKKGERKSFKLIATSGEVGAFSYFVADSNAASQVRFAWETPAQRQANIDKAVQMAKSADHVLLFAYNEGTEGVDRHNLSLPNNQDELISKIAQANNNTMVVLNTGDPITMPWIDSVSAVMQMWYPGQEGAQATVDLLLGNANPSGRLPVSYPIDESDLPMTKERQFPGKDGELIYDEGIYVGYRWYDKETKKTLFPFGHGLSYTNFSYSESEIMTNDNGGASVRFKITNTGKVAGADIPQIYLGAPEKPLASVAIKALVGFDRIFLNAGESKTVKIDLSENALNYWSVKDHQWMPMLGVRPLYIGTSTENYTQIGTIK